MNYLSKFIFFTFILVSSSLKSQIYSHLSLDNFEINNPSYVGLKEYSHISLDSKQSFDLQNKSSNNSTAYASYFFQDLNFFIGLKLNSLNISENGFNESNASISYVYRLNINDDNFVYPYISGNFHMPGKFSNLILEDNLFGGSTLDPLAINYESKNYVDINVGLMFKSTSYLASFSLNNLLKAKLTNDDSENPIRLNRTLDLNIGYQRNILRNTLSAAIIASYYHRPSALTQNTFSEIRFDQILLLDNGLEIGSFQEIFANSFSKSTKAIGFNAKFKFNSFEIGVNYKNGKVKEISNNENYLGVNLRYNFRIPTFIENLRKW